MSSVVFAGDTSGTITLAAPAVSGNTTLNLPATSGTLVSSGSIPAAGSTTQVQYNNAGVLAGSSNFVFSGTNVGIGTSSPARTLEVNGLGKFLSTVIIGGTAGSTDYNGYFTNQSFANNSDNTTVTLGTFSTRPLIFATNATERGRFDASGNFLFNSGYGSVATAYGCRAWANFTGAASIRGSGNISSITNDSTGIYTVNLSTAMTDTNYTVIGSCDRLGNGSSTDNALLSYGFTSSTSSFKIFTALAAAYLYTMSYNSILVIR